MNSKAKVIYKVEKESKNERIKARGLFSREECVFNDMEIFLIIYK